MGYGLGVVLLVLGLILALALNTTTVGPLNLATAGWILTVAGIAVIVITAVQTNARRRHTTVATTTDAQGRQATTERTTESDGPTPPVV